VKLKEKISFKYEKYNLAERYHASLSFIKSIKHFIEYNENSNREIVEDYIKSYINLFLDTHPIHINKAHRDFMREKIEKSEEQVF
jgi:hypothetical protein